MKPLLVAVLAIGSALPGYAQASNRVIAQIPFAFEVADRVVQPGEYTFTCEPLKCITVQSSAEKVSLMALVAFTEGPPAYNSSDKLLITFHRYEDRNFLVSVGHLSGKSRLTRSRNERDLITARKILVTQARPQVITVVAALP